MGSLSPMHWAIVIVVVLLLFGSRKLPDMARGVGQSMRILKAETRGMADDDRASRPREATAPSREDTAPNGGDGPASPVARSTSESSGGTAGPATGSQRPSSAERDVS